ncbi:MAG: GntR family transcriptional regulator [Ezakiella sp.]|nr:GntR family transcriptional regulator [Ezakiella sp.]MDD7471507.1 GntR family transcriptional regulator [Bacillota bacterium]MDY3923709.1 GntR family transcriptional regulator [Ezakiella sp.]
MKFDDNQPIFIQLANVFISQIVSNNLKKGEKLPSVRDIAKEYKVNPNTVTKTIDELVNSGLFEVRRGLGTFVIEDENLINKKRKEHLDERLRAFVHEFEKFGINREELVRMIMENENGDNITN